jgi:hypothetical protein
MTILNVSILQYFVKFLLDTMGLIPGYTFFAGCYLLWRQTYRISWGHQWFGALAILALVIANVLYTLTSYGSHFRPFINFAMTAWVFYNVWFFRKNPRVLAHLTEPCHDELPDYEPKTRLARLFMRPVLERSFWFSSTAKWLWLAFFLLLISAYFISKLANLAVWSDQRLVEAQKQFQVQAKRMEAKLRRELTWELTHTVAVAVDSLQKGQAEASTKAETAYRRVTGLERQVKENSEGLNTVKTKARRADAKADRALNNVTVPPGALYRLLPKSQFPLPPVKSPGGKKVGETESDVQADEDSLRYAKYWYQPQH